MKTRTEIIELTHDDLVELLFLIYNLRWEEGFPIITEKIQVSPKKRVAKYYIDPKYLDRGI